MRTGGIPGRSAICACNAIRVARGPFGAIHCLVGSSAPARQERWRRNVCTTRPGGCGECVRQETRDVGSRVGRSPGCLCSALLLPASF